MDLGEFAAYERSQGEKIIKVDDIYWRQVRPCFYRPLLPFREYSPEVVRPPRESMFGGVQHSLPDGFNGNSFLNLLLFEDINAYCTATLSSRRRKQLKAAGQRFIIQPVCEVEEFKKSAYPIYLSFYERTNYGYKSERRQPQYFSRWADSLFRFPKNLILGAYRDGRLQAILISQWVEDSIVYASMFCSTEALNFGVTSLVLHTVREAAASSQGVKRVFVGAYKYGKAEGVDQFYISRGCKLVRKPAALLLNPFASAVLRTCMAGQYAKLRGRLEDVVAGCRAGYSDPGPNQARI